MSRWREEHHELKTFIHCLVEWEVFLFTTTDVSFSVSLFETTGNLETSAGSSCQVVFVIVLVLFPVGLRPFGAAAIFREKSKTI